jgi:hypothetical protein
MKNLRLSSVLLFGLLFFVGCESRGCARKREVGRIYTSRNGTLYVRAHEKKKTQYNNTDSDDFIFWMSSDGGSSWNPASSVPNDLTITRRVIAEALGRPTGKVEEEENAEEEEVVDEQTTETEAESIDSDTGADADAGGSDSGSDGGGDGGGDD